jgi:diadenylate cyclase
MPERVFEMIAGGWTAIVEILILAAVLYFAYRNLRRTSGARILTALAIVFLSLALLSQILNLVVIGWLLRSLPVILAIMLVVIFQPELRRALSELGSHPFFGSGFEKRETIAEISDAAYDLASKGFGALFAIEREISLKPFAETGVTLDAEFSKELALTLFHPKTVLHDGAAVVHNDRIVAAGCIFPLTQREDLDRNLGLRHRAALGLSEESDGVAVVVSEETGQVSICHGGTIERNLKPEHFRALLARLLLNEPGKEDFSRRLDGQARVPDSRGGAVVSHPAERSGNAAGS